MVRDWGIAKHSIFQHCIQQYLYAIINLNVSKRSLYKENPWRFDGWYIHATQYMVLRIVAASSKLLVGSVHTQVSEAGLLYSLTGTTIRSTLRDTS